MDTIELPIAGAPSYKTLYIICTESQYKDLNRSVNKVRGYLRKSAVDTSNYAPEEPRRTDDLVVNIDPANCIFPVLADLQENYPELFEDYELVEL